MLKATILTEGKPELFREKAEKITKNKLLFTVLPIIFAVLAALFVIAGLILDYTGLILDYNIDVNTTPFFVLSLIFILLVAIGAICHKLFKDECCPWCKQYNTLKRNSENYDEYLFEDDDDPMAERLRRSYSGIRPYRKVTTQVHGFKYRKQCSFCGCEIEAEHYSRLHIFDD